MRPTGFEPAQPLRTTGTSGQRVYRSATNAWSRHPVPTRITCLTGARSQPCVTAKLPLMASNHEPPGSEPGALPIELSGIR